MGFLVVCFVVWFLGILCLFFFFFNHLFYVCYLFHFWAGCIGLDANLTAFGLNMLTTFSVNWKLGNINLKSVNVLLVNLANHCVCGEYRKLIMECIL